MRLLFAFLTLIPGAATAAPQAAPAPCPPATALPPGFEGMARRVALAPGGALTPGVGVDLVLSPVADVRYAVPPAKPGETSTYGGVASIAIAAAGTYRIALGNAAWIDIVRDGKAVPSTGHDHGPACIGVRKIVDFALAPGRYTLQIAGSTKSVIAALILAPR